jgi:hypothetical protein
MLQGGVVAAWQHRGMPINDRSACGQRRLRRFGGWRLGPPRLMLEGDSRWHLSQGPPDGRAPPHPWPLKGDAGSSRGSGWRSHLFTVDGYSMWSWICLGHARWLFGSLHG